jgi:ATP-dependent DNA helicase RecQ
LKLTNSARGVLKGETEVMLREEPPGSRIRSSRTNSRRRDLIPAVASAGQIGNPSLLAALRAWRSDAARQRGVPAYVVLHDSTIDGIAASRPTTPEELRGIPGIGDKKLEHYGDELIALVRAAER